MTKKEKEYELSQCPHCGSGRIKLEKGIQVLHSMYRVKCQRCYAQTSYWGSADLAVEKWNARVQTEFEYVDALERLTPKAPERSDGKIVCPFCGETLYAEITLHGEKMFFDNRSPHCARCGQAIDWREER